MIRPGSRVADPDSTLLGTVTEYPAVDPDGRPHPGLAAVQWDDGEFELVDIADIWPAPPDTGSTP